MPYTGRTSYRRMDVEMHAFVSNDKVGTGDWPVNREVLASGNGYSTKE
ncbi:hypothetical protein LL912_14490 [Niabella sp. CC-SYL272]|nr:hypothetical protein [Niabella agricola]MCF3109987.1 hypothetical protein [Niabella agricola]